MPHGYESTESDNAVRGKCIICHREFWYLPPRILVEGGKYRYLTGFAQLTCSASCQAQLEREIAERQNKESDYNER